MKFLNLKNLFVAFMMILVVAACNPAKKEESTEIAKEANDENFETRKDEKDADFIVDVIAGNYAELKLAELAKNKSTKQEVKDIARMLETDHTKIITELKGYANKKGISIPLEETEDAKKDIDDLDQKIGKDFDDKWCAMLIAKHEKSINKFEERWNKTEDTDLKDWINSTLPTLKSHLEMLQSNKEKVK